MRGPELQKGWIVCQIGARENYSLARALERRGALSALITDAWASDRDVIARLSRRLGERSHPDLAEAKVIAATIPAICLEAGFVLHRIRSWNATMRRNAWFQKLAARKVRSLAASTPGAPPIVFSYSYGAAGIFETAKAVGCRTVLGQIDPGPVESRLVDQLYREAGQPEAFEQVPQSYWDSWRREIALSDRVIVNSEWSREALLMEGVPQEKLRVLPLAYENKRTVRRRTAPSGFSRARPLKLLFLGQVTLRKGVSPMLAALKQLEGLPLELDVVGPVQCQIPVSAQNDPRIKFHGAVPRSEVSRFFDSADLFLFPTHSDGFGITQLESLAAGLPVVASRNCGRVIEHGVNGFVLSEVSAASIADCIRQVLSEPGVLKKWQSGISGTPHYDINHLGNDLLSLGLELGHD